MVTIDNGLRIGQLADATGVTSDTVRFYERQKLLPKPSRMGGGYRIYDRDAVGRLNFIRKAQRMGFSLDQIKSIFSERDRGKAPCESVLAMTRKRLEEVETELKHLQKTRRSLNRYLKEWENSGDASPCAAEEFCSLITRSEA